MGFKQISQRDLLGEFAEEFFTKIEGIVYSKSNNIAEYYYLFLQPNIMASEEEIKRFEAFLAKLEAYDEADRKEGYVRLVKWVKNSIQDCKEKKNARALSAQWQAQK